MDMLLLLLWLLPVASALSLSTLVVPSLTSINYSSNSTPIYIPVPAQSMDNKTYITINICSSPETWPTIYILNATSQDLLPELDDSSTTSTTDASGFSTKSRANTVTELEAGIFAWNITLKGNEGFGNWTGWMGDGGWIALYGDSLDIEIGIQSEVPIHSISTAKPMVGDTTSSQALLYSPILADTSVYETVQTYPNYTLSSPYRTKLDIPTINGQYLMDRRMYPVILDSDAWAVAATSNISDTVETLTWSMCAIKRVINETTDYAGFADLMGARTNKTTIESELAYLSTDTGNDKTSTTFFQRTQSWRWDWLTEGLSSTKNYTFWVIEPLPRDVNVTVDPDALIGGGRLYGPMWIKTKEDGFPCPLGHAIDLCPSISYAVSLDLEDANAKAITALPSTLEDTLINSLNSFSTSLLTEACGRDLYSPVSTCQDCFVEYREWACSALVPRCASQHQVEQSNNRTAILAAAGKAIPVPMTIRRNSSNPRTEYSSDPSFDYDELLPCLAQCYRVDRKCPVFLGFRCPSRRNTASLSYAFYGDDNTKGDGESDGGIDDWGTRWCSGRKELTTG